jgi:adenylate cyclase, class 2
LARRYASAVAIEIEAKVRVRDPASMRQRLTGLVGRAESRVVERNIFLDTGDEQLCRSGRGLRIRTMHDAGDGRLVAAVLTYKGPRLQGALKRREEIELPIADVSSMQSLLGRLGYEPRLEFEKFRETWRLDECEVVLDELPHLGHFLEVEGPSQEAVFETLARLDLRDEPLIVESYAHLVAEYLQRHPEARMVLRGQH